MSLFGDSMKIGNKFQCKRVPEGFKDHLTIGKIYTISNIELDHDDDEGDEYEEYLFRDDQNEEFCMNGRMRWFIPFNYKNYPKEVL
jgi:hypothetical protein